MGFGGGLVAIPLLSLIYPVKEAVTLYLFFQLIEVALIFKIRKEVDWKYASKLSIPAFIFAIVGSYSLSYLSETTLRLTLGALIILYLIKEHFFQDWRLNKKDSGVFCLAAGCIGGWLQGLIGAGGPAFLLYLNEINLSKSAFRGTMLVIAFSCNLSRILTSAKTGLLSETILELFFYCLPFVILAHFIGYHAHNKISQATYRKLTQTVMLLSAISLAAGALR